MITKLIRDVEVDIKGHNFENSPDINIFGFEYVTATDMNNQPFELTDEESEQLCIELSERYDEDYESDMLNRLERDLNA